MFSYLYYTVFPILGEFFGKLTAIADLPLYQFSMFLTSSISNLGYTNYFNGVNSSFRVYNFGLLGNIVNSILSVLWFNLPTSTPLWCAFLVSFAEVFLVASAIKFISSLF